MTQNTHAVDEAVTHAETALKIMRARRIPPNPDNFALWYTYCSGSDPHVKTAIDALIERGHTFTEENSASLRQQLLADPFQNVPLHLIAEKTESELTTVVALLENALDQASSYGESLEAALGKVGHVRRSHDLLDLLVSVLAKTQAMVKQSRDVESQLRLSLTEVGKLSDQLEEARREALTDALTGLSNRKMFDLALQAAADEASETGHTLSLILLDIDHFKNFNDTHGHSVGDQVLKLLASVLRDNCKGQDTTARFGGEEFSVILPNTTIENAAKLAETIRERVANKAIINRKSGDQLGRVHVSIGVSDFVPGETVQQLIERTDHALYTAKRTGRNKVTVVPGQCAKKVIGAECAGAAS